MKFIPVNLDALGMFASALCMVHCLAFPLILVLLPVLNLSASQPVNKTGAVVSSTPSSAAAAPADACSKECCHHSTAETTDDQHLAACCSTPTDFWIHVILLAGVAPLGMVAWGAGVRKHGRLGVFALGTTGVLLLGGALLFGHQIPGGYGEPVMTVLGSICMVSAHFWNRRQCQCCHAADPCDVTEIGVATPEVQPVSVQG